MTYHVNDLDLAHKHVASGLLQITAQEALVSELNSNGDPAQTASERLATLYEKQVALQCQLKRVQAMLGRQ